MAGGSGLTVKDMESDVGYTFSNNQITLPADANIVVVETFAITSYNGYYPSTPSCTCTKGTVTKIRGGTVTKVPTTSDLKYAIGSWLVINGGGGTLTVIHGGKTNVTGSRKVVMLSV